MSSKDAAFVARAQAQARAAEPAAADSHRTEAPAFFADDDNEKQGVFEDELDICV